MEPTDPPPLEAPPEDPEDWSDEQWIAWLKATDADSASAQDRPPTTTAGRIVRSTGGQLVGQSMIGLAQAIYGRRDDKPVIIAEANSEPEKDRPFALHLDPDHPEQSFVVLRPEPDPPGSGAS